MSFDCLATAPSAGQNLHGNSFYFSVRRNFSLLFYGKNVLKKDVVLKQFKV